MAAPPPTPLPAPNITNTTVSISTGITASRFVNTSDPRFDFFQWGLGYSGSSEPFLTGTLDEILRYVNTNIGQYVIILYGYSSTYGYTAASYQYITTGCPPADTLAVIPRQDALRFDKNYEIKGITFSFYKRDYIPIDPFEIPEVCQNTPGTPPISYSYRTVGGTRYDTDSSYNQRIRYTTIGSKLVEMTATSIYGETESTIYYEIIDYPTGGISLYDTSLSYGITNGYVQRGSTLLFTGNVNYFGGHTLSDIMFQWTIDGNLYYGQTLVYNFETSGSYLVGLTLMSQILGNIQTGITSQFYVGTPEIPDFYYDPITGLTAGRSITFGIATSVSDYGLNQPSIFDKFYDLTTGELPQEFV